MTEKPFNKRRQLFEQIAEALNQTYLKSTKSIYSQLFPAVYRLRDAAEVCNRGRVFETAKQILRNMMNFGIEALLKERRDLRKGIMSEPLAKVSEKS